MSERFLDRLAAVVRIPTVADDDDPTASHESLLRLHDFLEVTYPRTWAHLAVETISDHSLLLEWVGTEPALEAVVLMAHLDVVPVEAESVDRWSHPPFSGARTESHLFGRGAIDDKGSLIAILEAVEWLLENGFSPTRTIFLAFGHDEETMGSSGSAVIAETLRQRGVFADIVLDEGGFVTERVVPTTRRPVALLGVSEKGYADLELSSAGDPGHSSAPPKTTSIGAVARAIARLEASPMPAKLEVQTPFFVAASQASRPGTQRLLHHLPRLGRIAERVLGRNASTDALIRTTMAPTVISGGVKSNVLPASTRALINSRLMPGDTLDDLLAHVRTTVRDGVDVKLLRGWEASPVADTTSTGYRTVSEVIGEVFPDAVVAPWVVIGATDSRYFTGIARTVLRFLPFRLNADELTGFHGVDERIRVDDAEPAVRFYRRLLERSAG